jgi:hypothetical protein
MTRVGHFEEGIETSVGMEIVAFLEKLTGYELLTGTVQQRHRLLLTNLAS